MLETTILSIGTPGAATEAPDHQIRVLEADGRYGRFAVEPLERGYAITIGNALRRVLLSSMPGNAITWVKIDGALHEYAYIPHVKEEVSDILLNVKRVRIRSEGGRPGKMRLEISGEGRVCAGDIATSGDFEIVNPDLHLATLDSDDASLSVEFNVEPGNGYVPAIQGDGLPGLPIGVLPVDAIFNPIRKVNYNTERTRVGNATDYERLVIEIWTDGTITPVDAVRKSAEMLVNHFFLFSNVGRALPNQEERSSLSIPPEVYQTPIEKLDLSPRTLNCLRRAHIAKVGQALETSDADLLKIRNFGEKSLVELKEKLRNLGVADGDTSEAPTTLDVGDATVATDEELARLMMSRIPAEIDQENEEYVEDEEEDQEEDLLDEDEEEEEEEVGAGEPKAPTGRDALLFGESTEETNPFDDDDEEE